MTDNYTPPQSSSPSSSLSFTQGFLLGQLSIALLIAFFIKFFIFGDSPTDISARRAKLRRQRPSFSQSARPDITGQNYATHNSSNNSSSKRISSIIRASPALTTSAILAKTYYNVNGHQPESVDWFNVLVAQTIAQLRMDAQQDNAILTSLMGVLNGPKKPEFVDEIKVTEINLGEEFPIFSNCRVTPVEGGAGEGAKDGVPGRLQARMDVDLSDAITLGIETKLVLNYPRPLVAVMPVALAVSVVRFSGTLSISFIPSPSPVASNNVSSPTTNANGSHSNDTRPTSAAPSFTHLPSLSSSSIKQQQQSQQQTPPADPTPPTTLTFSFLPDYRLELSTHSLLGSRSRLQDVPKISQLVEARLHDWFDERCVEPRFQQVVLPSLWPRRKNTRGGDVDVDGKDGDENVMSVPGAFGAGKVNGNASTAASRMQDIDPREALAHQQYQAPQSQQRPQPTTTNSSTTRQQLRNGQLANPTEQLRQRYSRAYEGEVQSSPPRRAEHDDGHEQTQFVSGHDLSKRLHREQQQQQHRQSRV